MGVNFNPAGKNTYVNRVNSQQNQNNDVKEAQTSNAKNSENTSVKEGKLIGLEILGDLNRIDINIGGNQNAKPCADWNSRHDKGFWDNVAEGDTVGGRKVTKVERKENSITVYYDDGLCDASYNAGGGHLH